jgi:hypothetical protein
MMESIESWLKSNPVLRNDPGIFDVKELRHELSDWMAPFTSGESQDGRSLFELKALRSSGLGTVAEVISGGPGRFSRALREMHCVLLAGGGEFRRGPIASMPDKKGIGILYPPVESIHPQLDRLARYWASHVAHNRSLAAIVAMTGLMNLHPFVDGNGRVARLLFHWTLNIGRETPIYLPLYELSALSRCGYLVRLRQAQYHGEWEPLVGFIVMVADRFLRVADERPRQGVNRVTVSPNQTA